MTMRHVRGYSAKSVTPPPGAPEGVKGLQLFIASTETVDRYGDVIKQDGWEFEEFDRNPVFLSQHNSWSSPVGSIPYRSIVTDEAWLKSQGVEGPSALVIGVKWDEADEDALKLKGKYDRGVMSAVSVGFYPLASEPIKNSWGVTILRANLLEVSAVTIPANPEAVAVRDLRGADTDDERAARALLYLAQRGLITVRTDVPSTPTEAADGGQLEPDEAAAPHEAQDTDETDAGEAITRSADTTPEPSEPIVLRLIQTTGEIA